ncbi:hypothetical protein GJ496_004774 [Pomphorhynchus laevis]|nr:hypothetical protein GJ496_004774 [Pomphorhynchus laevis]
MTVVLLVVPGLCFIDWAINPGEYGQHHYLEYRSDVCLIGPYHCTLVHQLPQSTFVSLFDINDWNNFPAVRLSHYLDIETFANCVNCSNFKLFIDLSSLSSMHIVVPIHTRYQYSSSPLNNQLRKIQIYSPSIICLGCDEDKVEISNMSSKFITVPVGNIHDLPIVMAITYLVVYANLSYLNLCLHRFRKN